MSEIRTTNIVDIAVYKYQNVIIEIMWARVSAFRIVRHL